MPEGAFFDQLGIQKVVWVDDLFDPVLELSEADIAERIAIAISSGTLASSPKLDDLSEEDSGQEWARRIRERLTPGEIVEFLAESAPLVAEPAQGTADYSEADIATIVASLSGNLE